MASSTDKVRKSANNFVTNLSSAIIGTGDTSMSLGTTANLPTDTAVDFVIDRVDTNGNLTPSKREYVKGVVSGSTITALVRGLGGSTAQAHSNGAVVEAVWTSEALNDSVDAFLAQHNQDGTHGAITSTGASLTTPKIITSANDTNNNEIFKIGATASAVNEVTLTNAATGNAPQISASGDDTNVDLKFAAKGTGKVTGVVENMKNPYKFSVYRNAAWTTGATSLVQFDTKTYDTGTNVDVVTNKGRFTAPIAGFYHFSSTVTSNIASGGGVLIAIYKNGVLAKQNSYVNGAATTQVGINISADLQLAASDYVEIYYQGSTSTGGVGATNTYFDGHLVSAA